MEKLRVLIVDDDPNISQLIKLYLDKEGYETETSARGDDAVFAFKKNPPNIVVLDLMLPGMDGWQVCREIRKTSTIPIIMLTAKDETFDKVLGLELGADDYMTKPFDPKELVARIKAVIRRTQVAEQPKKEIAFPNLVTNMSTYIVTFNGQDLEMPPKEIELLFFLASHPNTVFTRDQLLEQVWGFDYFGDSRTVDVHVKRIREKLPNCEEFGWRIKTRWSVGYSFEVK